MNIREAHLRRFWPQGEDKPFVFVNVVGTEGGEHTGQRGKTKVGLESKFNRDEARKIVSLYEDIVILRHTVPLCVYTGKHSFCVGTTTSCASESNCSTHTILCSKRRNQKAIESK